MENVKPRCPYCKKPQEPAVEVCSACGATLPWVHGHQELRQEIANLRAQVKEREVSRFRATVTLVEEFFVYARGGQPVSLAALKGFITAWLFPRTLIVIGSIVGGLILAVQTYIIWSQTQLLAQQADTARIEQAGKLRERIAARNQFIDRIGGVYPSKIKQLQCEEKECSNVTLHDVAARQEDKSKWGSIDNYLQSIVDETNTALALVFALPNGDVNRTKRDGPLPRRSDFERYDKEVLRQGTIQCNIDPEKIRKARLLTSVLIDVLDDLRNKNLARETAHWMVQWEAGRVAKDSVPLISGKEYPAKDFAEDFRKVADQWREAVAALGLACLLANELDEQAMRKLEAHG